MPQQPTSQQSTPSLRPGARVVLLDGEHRALLFATRDPALDGPPLWLTPGGALEEGESYEDCARRELWEETGLRDVDLGPCVWVRRHVWRWGERLFDSRERYYLARVARFEVRPQALGGTEADMEAQSLLGSRWWSVDEIAASDDVFVPLNLAELLRPLIAGEVPAAPLEVGE